MSTPQIGALGRRPHEPGKPVLKLADFLKVAPPHPISVDNTNSVTYGLDGNDHYGVCVPTSLDNLRRTVTRQLTGRQVDASQEDIFAWYRSQNPHFDPATDDDDNGMNMQDFLTWATKQGLILGFGFVDPGDDALLTAAEYLFLGVLWGVDLQTAQQTQSVWDYRTSSGEWGGHAVMVPAYESNDEQDVISWAQRIPTTDRFRRHQLQEAYVVILPEHVAHPEFREGFDLEKFAAAFTGITGRPFPANPNPGPSPTPDPGAAPFLDASTEVSARIARSALRAGLSISDYQERHWRRYFKL